MFERILDGSLMPHGHCLLWRKDLLFLHIVGDTLTFTAYFLIPLALIYLVKKRDDLKFDWIFLMFAAFILLCGITHLFGLVNIWQGYYFLAGTAKLATGVVSIFTALMLWKLMPKALAIPSNDMLEQRNHELMATQMELEKSNRNLEKRVIERTQELALLAKTDSLTGLSNHGDIINTAKLELERSARYKHEFSLIMLDIDHFKEFNDKFGHRIGDRVLVEAARTIQFNCRYIDKVGRYGGEEFMIVCPETNLAAAADLAERIRLSIAAIKYEDVPPITCSLGVATYNGQQNIEELIDVADKALYQAKDEGRNKVVKQDKI